MFLSGSDLFILGIGLIIVSYLFGPSATTKDSLPGRIRVGLLGVARMLGISALLAGIVLWVLPVLESNSLDNDTLNELNTKIAGLHESLEYSWLVLLGFSLALLFSALLAVREVSAARARFAGNAIKATSQLKTVVAFLSMLAFTGSGLEAHAAQRLTEAQSVRAELVKLQVRVFSKAKRFVETEIVADALQRTNARVPAVNVIRAAYGGVVSEVAGYPGRYRKDGTDASVIDRVASLDVSTTQAEREEKLIDAATASMAAQDDLVRDVVDLTFDNGIADRLRSFIISIDNPLLSELADAFLQPAFFEPVKRFAAAQASAFLRGKIAPSDFKTNAIAIAPASDSVAMRLIARHAHASSLGASLGDPDWDRLRTVLVSATGRGVFGYTKEDAAGAQAAASSFASYWQNLQSILGANSRLRQNAESLFADYLTAHEGMAAMWGYAVISATPDRYKDALKQTALSDAGRHHLNRIRNSMRARDSGDAKAAETLADIGIPTSLGPNSSDQAIAEALFDGHGPYPEDGYVTYVRTVAKTNLMDAASYFESKKVGDYVDKFCPMTHSK